MKKTILFSLLGLVVLVAGFLILTALSVKNSKGCASFVIDSTEANIHIDIPKTREAFCLLDEERSIRTGIFVLDQELVNLDNYIDRYSFWQI